MSALATTAQGGPNTDVEDSELVRRVRRGDESAFEQLYHRYHRRITAYIFGMVHDHGRAEDIAQDVFVSALRRMRETDRPIAFKPWVYEIAKNACIDQFRRSKRAEEVSYDADEGMGAADYGRLVSSDAMPENELESKQNLAHLRGAFGGLSETHHEILVMRELEGLSYREIGERLGMSRPSVESTLFRARRRLTEEYEELVSGQRCQRIQAIIAAAAAAAPGARDQRRLARHVSHCQPCRRQARLAGLDIPVTADRPIRQRIAALIPLPLFLRRRWSADSDASSLGSGHVSGFAQWSAQLGATMDPSWLKAAATAATVAVAGAGAGIVGGASAGRAPIGNFGQVLPILDDESSTDSGVRPRADAALSKGVAAPASRTSTTSRTATVTARHPEAARPAATTTATSTTSTAPAAPVDVAGTVQQVAKAVHPATGGSAGAPSLPGGSSSGGGDGTPVQKTSVPAATVPLPPASGTATVPSVTVAAPDVQGTVDDASKSVGDALNGN